MDTETEKRFFEKEIEKEIENVNEEIKSLGYRLSELLNRACSFGVCTFDPEVNDAQSRLKKQEEKKVLFEHLRRHIDSCLKELGRV